jgi:drug/metabolite transporter (DMT)-like permease
VTTVTLMALCAAFLFALAALLQQRAARESATVRNEAAPVSAALTGLGPLMRGLVRSRSWLLGWITNLSGFLAQASALHLGSVAAAQPWMTTQLLFALPLSAAERRRRPLLRDWISVALVCLGLVLLLSVESTTPLSGTAHRARVMLAAFSAAVLVLILVTASRRVPTRGASLLVAVAAGLCFAMSAVFMKMTTEDLLGRGVAATAVDWPGYCLAISALGGLLLEQAAFAGGPMPWAVAGMSVTNPAASLAVGLLAFRVPVPDDAWSLATIAASGALVTVGIVGLAHSPTMQHLHGQTPWTDDASVADPPLRRGGDHAEDQRVSPQQPPAGRRSRWSSQRRPSEEMR